MVEFYARVRDQVENLTPLGTGEKDTPPWLAPRLSDWLAACEIYGVPPDRRAELVDAARYLHEALGDRLPPAVYHGLLRVDPAELAPPGDDWWPTDSASTD